MRRHHGPHVDARDMCRQRALRVLAPRGNGALGFRRFAPDETDEDVQAADGEEEEGCDEGECVDAVRENGGADAFGTGGMLVGVTL